MVNQRELTEDGLEKNFATNTLGNNIYVCECQFEFEHLLTSGLIFTSGVYILTSVLIPALKKVEDPRVVG